ncbi:dUTP diphosphatase [Candidatus Saccharibacteria bacterium]|jgi:dUTP pyrophosphatase|nr:dUTP diphosphatase [Candidatus Saccharibacteria bacterium]
MKIYIKKLHENAVLPSYATEHAAGMDLAACIDEPIVLQPHERAIIPTGIAIALPPGYEAQVRGRSGLAAKHGVMPANGVGTIDADYRGEIGVILLNTTTEPFTIEPGMRVAQLVIAKYEMAQWNEVDELDETARGEGGYGSTGK